MKVIDLLNKIRNEEYVPKKLKYKGDIFNVRGNNYYSVSSNRYLFNETNILTMLNDEIEIIEDTPKLDDAVYRYYFKNIIEDTPKEDKKIEKLECLNTDYFMERKKYGALTNEEIVLDIQTLKNYINEIIDKVNGE